MFLRAILIAIIAMIITTTKGEADDASSIDFDGVEASRLGIPFRASSLFISFLIPDGEGWKVGEIDRSGCENYEVVLKEATEYRRVDQLTGERLDRLVAEAGMSAACLTWVGSSEHSSAPYPVLLTVEGDFVFYLNRRSLYTRWDRINHTTAALDMIYLEGKTYGIAPAP